MCKASFKTSLSERNLRVGHAGMTRLLAALLFGSVVLLAGPGAWAMPVITVLGPNPYYVRCGDPYIDPGATAYDPVDGSVSVDVGGTGVDVNVPGSYAVDYYAMSSEGNLSFESRTVVVRRPCPVELEVVRIETLAQKGNITIQRVTLSDGSRLTRKVGPNDSKTLGTYTVRPGKGNGVLGTVKGIYRKKNGEPMSETPEHVKTAKVPIGRRGKAAGDCVPLLETDLTEFTFLEDNVSFSGADTGELTITGPLTEEDSGAYLMVYWSEDDQEWLTTQHVQLEVAEDEDAVPDQQCGTPFDSIDEAYENPDFRTAIGIPGGEELNDLDGGRLSQPNIDDRFEIAPFQQAIYGYNIHPFADEAEEAYAYNRMLLETDGSPLVQTLRDTGALPFVAATLAISSEWQATWAGLGLTNQYQVVTGGGKTGNGEPFSPGGDLDGDGVTNQEVFEAVAAAGGDVYDYIEGVDPAFYAGPPEMPVAGGAAVALLFVVAAAAALRRRRSES